MSKIKCDSIKSTAEKRLLKRIEKSCRKKKRERENEVEKQKKRTKRTSKYKSTYPYRRKFSVKNIGTYLLHLLPI